VKINVQLIHDLPLFNIKVSTVFQMIWLDASNTDYRHRIPPAFLSGLGFLRDRGKSQFLSVVSKTLSIVHRGQPTVKQKALLTVMLVSVYGSKFIK